jgi:hypothetical protein
MTSNVLHRAALGLTLLASVHAAQAATVTLNSWTFGSGKTVHTVAPGYNGAAGGFSGSLDGAGLMTYCVELTQSFNWNTSYTHFTDETALDYFGAGSDKALKLAKLVSYAFYDKVVHVGTAAQSTSLQLAIWNVVYDGDYSLSSGSFADTSGYASYASTLLNASQSFTNMANVWVLASPGQQDQLHWGKLTAGRPSNADAEVPEPATLALVLAALGAAAFAARGRNRG